MWNDVTSCMVEGRGFEAFHVELEQPTARRVYKRCGDECSPFAACALSSNETLQWQLREDKEKEFVWEVLNASRHGCAERGSSRDGGYLYPSIVIIDPGPNSGKEESNVMLSVTRDDKGGHAGALRSPTIER